MSLLDALQYVGDTLSKPGRAVRGLLGGRPEEALAALPFSDSLGLTDPGHAVSGRMLLDQLGVTDREDDGFGAAAAGFGADVLTDPLTYAGGALTRLGLKALNRPAAAVTPAAGAVDDGTFSLIDPISRLVPKEEEARQLMRGATSPWEPPTRSIDLGPLESVPTPGLRPSPGPIPLPPHLKPLDALPEPSPYWLDYGSHASNPGEFLTSLPNDAVMEGNLHAAWDLGRHGWDTALADLERLTPEARVALVGDGGEVAGHRGWQQLLGTRAGDLDAVARLAEHGVFPAELGRQAAAQLERLRPHLTWSANSPLQTAMYDLTGGLIRPVNAADHLGGVASFLPTDAAAVRRYAAARQEAYLRSQIEDTVARLAGEGRTPGQVEMLANEFNPEYLRQQLGHLGDADFWVNGEGIEPNIVRRILGEGPTTPTGATMSEVRRLLDAARAEELAAIRAGQDPAMLNTGMLHDGGGVFDLAFDL